LFCSWQVDFRLLLSREVQLTAILRRLGESGIITPGLRLAERKIWRKKNEDLQLKN
jgi:hypothetical protein